jgi:hypothetical protein
MPKYISSQLSRLIRARAYAEGNLGVAKRELEKLRPTLQRLLKARREGQREVEKLNNEIKVLAPDLDTSKIQPRRNIRRRTWKYGEFTNFLLWYMNERIGTEVVTTELIAVTAKHFQIPLVPYANYDFHRRRVARILSEWVAGGLVERLHVPDGREEGRWRLLSPVAVQPRDRFNAREE